MFQHELQNCIYKTFVINSDCAISHILNFGINDIAYLNFVSVSHSAAIILLHYSLEDGHYYYYYVVLNPYQLCQGGQLLLNSALSPIYCHNKSRDVFNIKQYECFHRVFIL